MTVPALVDFFEIKMSEEDMEELEDKGIETVRELLKFDGEDLRRQQEIIKNHVSTSRSVSH